MANKKIYNIEKLPDTHLENISGGGVLSLTAKTRIETAGEVVAAVGMLGYGICKISNSVCKTKSGKTAERLSTAESIFKGIAAVGGATYLGGMLG